MYVRERATRPTPTEQFGNMNATSSAFVHFYLCYFPRSTRTFGSRWSQWDSFALFCMKREREREQSTLAVEFLILMGDKQYTWQTDMPQMLVTCMWSGLGNREHTSFVEAKIEWNGPLRHRERTGCIHKRRAHATRMCARALKNAEQRAKILLLDFSIPFFHMRWSPAKDSGSTQPCFYTFCVLVRSSFRIVFRLQQ